MRKKIVLLAFVSMLLALATLGTRTTVPVTASTRKAYLGIQSSPPVHNIDTGLNYSTIQGAINAPETLDGHTIQVDTGTYYEHVIVNKTVSLVGEDRVTTIVDGQGTGPVIKVTADNVNVTGFAIQNAGVPPSSGVFVASSTGSTISYNIIKNNFYGIELLQSNGNSIIGNTIMNSSWAGIYISDSNGNIFYDNIVAYNSAGAWIASSTVPNTFYHNNFIDNADQGYSFPSSIWDNGAEGNYWSDYTGIDTDGDGVGDDEYLIDIGTDSYPLIIPTKPFPVVWDDVIYPVALLSNSTVSSFYFSQPSKEIGFNVTGPLNTIGFCNVTIPQALLHDDPWKVKIGNTTITPTIAENGTHTFLHFNYNHSTYLVKIMGTWAIPEFSAAMILPLFIIITLAVAVLRKRKKGTPESQLI